MLESLFDRPIVAVNHVRQVTGTAYAAANSLVTRLVEIGAERDDRPCAQSTLPIQSIIDLFT